MISHSFLTTLVLGVLLFTFLIILLFKKMGKKVFYVLTFILLVLVIKDVASNYILIHRANIIRYELKPGMTVDQLSDYLKANKKRLHISDWRYSEQGEQGWFFIDIDGPFSLIALITRYESAWYLLADIDKNTKIMKKIR